MCFVTGSPPLNPPLPSPPHPSPATCTDVLLSYCDDMPYTQTLFPSLLGYRSWQETELSAEYLLLSVVESLLGGECNPDIRMLGCSVLVPHCQRDRTLLPCRSTCDAVQMRCSHAFEAIDMEWPYFLNCDRFFSADEEHCYDPLEGLKGELSFPLYHLSVKVLRQPGLLKIEGLIVGTRLVLVIFTHLLEWCSRH